VGNLLYDSIYWCQHAIGVNMPANEIYVVIDPLFDGTRASTGLCLENFDWWSDYERWDEAIEAKREEVADFLRDLIDVPIEVKIVTSPIIVD